MQYAFIFPGQGSQFVGMLEPFWDQPVVKEALSEASEAISLDIGNLIKAGPLEALNQTVNTQPIMLATSVALFRYFCSVTESRPSVVAGHSLGEYSALVAAQVLSLSDAVKIVRLRAQAMQEAVPLEGDKSGSMVAVLGLDDDEIIAICQDVTKELNEVVEAVNFNAPSQVVIAGHKKALAEASSRLKSKGAKRVVPLPVSAPFHSSLLHSAGVALSKAFPNYTFSEPTIAVVNNVDVAVEKETQAIQNALVRQVDSPVRWREVMEKIASQYGIKMFAECGAGKVLTGLVKRNVAGADAVSLGDLSSFESFVASLA